MRPAGKDRRTERRRPARGEVVFLIEEPVPRRFGGQLMDISKSGFRAGHQLAELQSGMDLDYTHAYGSGRARVMWTTIISGRIESGFLKL